MKFLNIQICKSLSQIKQVWAVHCVHQLEAAGRVTETQIQVGENLNKIRKF